MARTVIRGATLVTMEAGTGIPSRGDILVDGERIVAVAPPSRRRTRERSMPPA